MKCRFKTNKLLTAVKETEHTVTTSEGKIIHKKLASKPMKFLLPKKSEEKRKPTNRASGAESSVKETIAIRTKECMESPKIQTNRVAATPSRQCRRKDQPTVTSP